MKAAKIVLVLVLSAALIHNAKIGYRYFLPQTLPFCGGLRPSIYDLIGILMIILFVYLLRRMSRQKRRSNDGDIYNQLHRQSKTDSDIYGNRYRQRPRSLSYGKETRH